MVHSSNAFERGWHLPDEDEGLIFSARALLNPYGAGPPPLEEAAMRNAMSSAFLEAVLAEEGDGDPEYARGLYAIASDLFVRTELPEITRASLAVLMAECAGRLGLPELHPDAYLMHELCPCCSKERGEHAAGTPWPSNTGCPS
ncbi:MAG: hypothetical protein ACHQC8_06555 [Solirubrobacterales bacterium]